GLHFPQDEQGRYAGYYSANGLAAVAHLEVLRSRGVEYLLFPDTARWWLEKYPEFAAHLTGRYRVFADEEKVGVLYALTLPASSADPENEVDRLFSRFRVAHGRDPVVLDWNTGKMLTDRFPGLPVFQPPSASGILPYIDHSVDVVAVASEAPNVLAEAQRVAEVAV